MIFMLGKLMIKKEKISKNNVVKFPSKMTDLEKQIEAVIFAAAEPLDIDTIESKISKKIDNRSLLIFHKNLKKNSFVKITNPINQKTVIAEVISNKARFSDFYTFRIFLSSEWKIKEMSDTHRGKTVGVPGWSFLMNCSSRGCPGGGALTRRA